MHGLTTENLDSYTGKITLDLKPEHRQALAFWNKIVTGLNENGGKHLDCLAVRMKAVEEYRRSGRSLTDLAEAFKILYPHWGPYPDHQEKALRLILGKLFSSHFIPMAEAAQYHIPTSWFESRNLSIPQKPAMILTRRNCIIHPSRPVRYKRLGLCSSCYVKANRLGITHLITLPIKEIVKIVLGTRIPSRRKKTYCVNHPDRESYNGTYCAECLINRQPSEDGKQ